MNILRFFLISLSYKLLQSAPNILSHMISQNNLFQLLLTQIWRKMQNWNQSFIHAWCIHSYAARIHSYKTPIEKYQKNERKYFSFYIRSFWQNCFFQIYNKILAKRLIYIKKNSKSNPFCIAICVCMYMYV